MMPSDCLPSEYTSESLPSSRELPPFDALRAFDAIARLGGVRKAAQYLHRDNGSVSRHLRALEEWTGTKLIERTSVGTALTADGSRYHARIAAAIDVIAAATADVMNRGDNHRLQIRCPHGFAMYWLSARLGAFERANPGLTIEVRSTGASLDTSFQRADVDIRFVAHEDDSCDAPAAVRRVELARSAVIAVASRDYLSRSNPIREPRDLLDHQLLHEENHDRWCNWLASHSVTDRVELSGPRLWQDSLTLDAARHGRGVALTDHVIACDDLSAGRLVDISRGLASFMPPSRGAWQLVARADRWDAAPVRRFRDWLISAIAATHPQIKAVLLDSSVAAHSSRA